VESVNVHSKTEYIASSVLLKKKPKSCDDAMMQYIANYITVGQDVKELGENTFNYFEKEYFIPERKRLEKILKP